MTYPDVGATRGPDLPAGYRTLALTAVVGHGRDAFEDAAAAVLEWRMHRGAGLRVAASAPRAVPGAEVVLRAGIGPFRLAAPCRVVWTVEERDRAGFAYGTLPGHPECGEEAFTVELAEGLAVRVTVRAFSRPGRWYTRVAGPVARAAQRAATRRYVYAVAREVRRAAGRRAVSLPGDRRAKRSRN